LKTYNLEFHILAKKEWDKLDSTIKEQFKKQLAKRLSTPHVPSALLSKNLEGCYKIKLRSSGYRLVYEVIEQRVTVLVIAVGRRDKEAAYAQAATRVVHKVAKK
jgi:mRNA interferase RelE/StbE